MKPLENCLVGRLGVPVDRAVREILLVQCPLTEVRAAEVIQLDGLWVEFFRDTALARPLRFFSVDEARATAANLQAQTDTNFYFVVRVAAMAKDDALVWPTPGIIGAVASLA